MSNNKMVVHSPETLLSTQQTPETLLSPQQIQSMINLLASNGIKLEVKSNFNSTLQTLQEDLLTITLKNYQGMACDLEIQSLIDKLKDEFFNVEVKSIDNFKSNNPKKLWHVTISYHDLYSGSGSDANLSEAFKTALGSMHRNALHRLNTIAGSTAKICAAFDVINYICEQNAK